MIALRRIDLHRLGNRELLDCLRLREVSLSRVTVIIAPGIVLLIAR